MSRLWLALGMFLSLLVPVGYPVYAATHPSEPSTQSLNSGSTSTAPGSSETGQPAQDAAVLHATRAVKTALAEVRRLNAVKNWKQSDSVQAVTIELDMQDAAQSLASEPLLRRVALRTADFAGALAAFGRHPTQARYRTYDKTRKALNRAISAAQ